MSHLPHSQLPSALTHTAYTPVPDAFGLNLFTADPYAQAMAALYIPEGLFQHLLPHFERLGAQAGGKLDALASIADKHPPTLSVRTRSGIDTASIHKHPAYVELEKTAYMTYGLAALSHKRGVLGWNSPMPAAAKYALTYLFVQAEFGLCCPVSMTDSLMRTLKKYGDPEVIAKVLPKILTDNFDELHQGAMFMTEQGAGSDVSATAVVAEPDTDGMWRLTGDKWFCSNPDAGFAMVLARSEATDGLKGVSLFLLPRDLENGQHNHYRILRLKDKLGTRSMASGEIRLEGAKAWLIGERGRGFKQMADMINNSRLSNGMRAAGLMRRATTDAIYFAQHRIAFQKRIIELPLMQRQLVKMLVWTEQARSMMFQTADALTQADTGQGSSALPRILTPLIKFRACRDARKVAGDAMEVKGGCGYIEEWSDPRILRDAHLGSIWEGTSNIVALDVLRAIQKENALPVLREHVEQLLASGRPAPDHLLSLQNETIQSVFAFAQTVAEKKRDVYARQVASQLYHVVSMAAMRYESMREGLEQRSLLADMVLQHRLLPAPQQLLLDEDERVYQTLLAYALHSGERNEH